MNTSQKQITSFVAWLLNALSGGVIAYTAAKSPAAQSLGQFLANLITGPDMAAGIVLIITKLVTHYMHEDITQDNPTAAKSTGGNSLLVLVASFWILAAGATGCASAPGVAFKATGTADSVAVAALGAWNDYCAANHPPVSQQLAVKAAFQKFKAAEVTALDVALVLQAYSATNSADSAFALAKSTAAVSAETDALTDLINLLKSFGVKI